MTADEFVKWVAGWVLDGDLVKDGVTIADADDPDAAEYELENDEVYENYTVIVSEARRLLGEKADA
jgi:hypothetical protein